MATQPRYVVLISGSGTNLQALIDATERGEIAGELVAVLCNKPHAKGLERAALHGIATDVVEHTQFSSREAYDQALMAAIDCYQPDLVVLAGFMRILTPEFVAHYHGRLLNIHPSLLPEFKGLHTHQRALDAHSKRHGCSVHFVTAELDGGPVVAQACVPVMPDDTPITLAERVQTMEYPLYTQCVALFLAGRLRLDQDTGVPLLDGKPISKGALDMGDSLL